MRFLPLLALLITAPDDPLPGTLPLEAEGDLASDMVDGIHRFLDRETADSVERRAPLWKRDRSSPEAYSKSVAPNRTRLGRMIGVVDSRRAALDGLMLQPEGKPRAFIIVVPDADQTPEMLSGVAGRLAGSGCRVWVPDLADRADTWSVAATGRATNQPHREFVYRPAFEVGRHIIGYEVRKVMAAVDGFIRESGDIDPAVGVYGYGEGGLIALHAGALDPRIDVTGVSGYFGPREDLWKEPIYRNVFGLLHEFGDAEIASLIAPRALVVEASPGPRVDGPPAPRQGRSGAAPGKLEGPPAEASKREFDRARSLVGALPSRFEWFEAEAFGGEAALAAFLGVLGGITLAPPGPPTLPAEGDPAPRRRRQFEELVEDTQAVMRDSERLRAKFWGKLDKSSPEKYEKSIAPYREFFAEEVIGRFDRDLLPPAPRSRRIFDEPAYTGYEVRLDVYPDVFASGILLVPKGIKDGERRPAVVCQHGLEGRPRDLADPKVDNKSYNRYGCRLAERGFVVYAPQNPYLFGDRFRSLQRKLNPLKKTLFSIIVPQHQQTVEWLAGLPFVDPERIAFYGLSYGGKTAMRVPPLVPRYCLSICSADFNEWVRKNASMDYPGGYLTTGEYEIFEWDLGSTFNYAEMASLIAPRPFMVERGHRDGVAPDEWVAYEYAKVRRHYADLKIPGRRRIEFFEGPHTIHGVGTFEFLHEHLKWPAPK